MGCAEKKKQDGTRMEGTYRHDSQPTVETEGAQHPAEVVAERHQAPFAADLGEAAHQEVTVAGAACESAERVFGQRLAAAHHVFASDVHARAVPLDHVLVHPTLDLAMLAACPQAPRPQRADPADRLAAGIADHPFAAGLTLLPAHRPQLCVGRTA